jgi:hypothetical protein
VDEVLLWGSLGVLAYFVLAGMNQSGAFAGISQQDFGGSNDANVPNFTGEEIVSPDTTSMPSKLIRFADAIANFEGGASTSLNMRNNNPGNLKAAPDEFTGNPTQRDSNGFVIFPSLDAGYSALYAQLNKTVTEFPQLNLQQFFARYLGQTDFLNPKPTDQGNPLTYAQTVANKLGVSPTDSLSSIFGG